MVGVRTRVTTGAMAVAALVAGLTGCTDDGGSPEAFCKAVKAVPSLESVVTGFDDADRTELTARLDAAEDAYGELRSTAPGEIDDDVDDVVDLVDAVIDAVRRHRADPEAVAAQVRRSVGDHPDAAAAATRLGDYGSKTCKVELNPVVEGDTATTTAPPPAD